MLIAAPPANEEARLRLLRSLGVLDTPPEEVFDRVTRVTSEMLDLPIALVSLVDEKRQWFKSKVGLDVCETSRDMAFCAHALHVPEILVVEDAAEDPRFNDNPLVTGHPLIRFYAGVPLRTEDGLALGTLCAIGPQPRILSSTAQAALRDLAKIVEHELLSRSMKQDFNTVWEGERQARRLSEARFSTVFLQTPTGKAIMSLDGHFAAVNPKLCEITGYSAGELSEKTFAEITHPDDLEKDLALVADLLAGNRTQYAMEKRYIRKDGSSIWAELNVALVRTDRGKPDHFIAVVLDISVRKQGEAALLHHQEELERKVLERTLELTSSRETLQVITDNLPILIAQVSRDLRYRFNNEMYREVFGVEPSSLVGKPINATIRPELYEELLPYFTKALAGEKVTHEHVRYIAEQDRVWSSTYVPDIRNGEIIGFFVMSQDVTERKRVERTLHDKAMLDPLTELPNRRALQERLSTSVIAAQDESKPFAVFFMDLDGFKAVNDEHGHDAGDELLRQVATRLKKTMRKDDLVCRLAGDEFVVITGGVATQEAARQIAESLCGALSTPFSLNQSVVRIGVSLGITLCPAKADISAEAILTRADSAMYEAKRRGRNGYRFSADIDPQVGG